MELLFNCPLPLHELSGNQCDLCQHKVVDCTSKTDAEINLLATKTTKFCGIFKSNQINNRQQSINHSAFKIAFLFVFILGFNQAKAATFIQQNLEKSAQVSALNSVSDTLADSPVLKGVVSDENGEPLLFAKIIVESEVGIRFYTFTDHLGAYKILLKDIPLGSMVSVTCNFIGFETSSVVNVKIASITNVDITMNEETCRLIVGIVVSPQYQHIPTDPYDFGKQKVVVNERR
ncbi:MAG: carboxypeptidase regulatory-like domain-containing protein [Crocinitomix sp.]|nr:carboxypeptidase regulatory-like domain-containing protein [Crocinitomix sp.]